MIEALYRAGADDLTLANRAEKESLVTVYGLCAVDVRQARIDEIPHERVWVTMKMLMPNGLDEPSSGRCVTQSEGPDLPKWRAARGARPGHRAVGPLSVLRRGVVGFGAGAAEQ